MPIIKENFEIVIFGIIFISLLPIVFEWVKHKKGTETVSYTHLRAHETVLDLVCRLLLEKKKTKQ